LISREALMQEIGKRRACSHSMTLSDAEFIDLITNAPAVSDEPAARFVSKRATPEGTQEFFGLMLTDNIEPLSLLYTTPQQPQSVADALEEAAKAISERKQSTIYSDESVSGLMCYNEGLDVAIQIIRTLIKRNEVNHG